MTKLYYFSQSEFERNDKNWYDNCDTRLLVLIDSLRFKFGDPISISPHPRAIGRNDGDHGSYHNIDKHGKVYAIDLLPKGTEDKEIFEYVIELAFNTGFTGIGVYPHWNPRPGIHVDTRPDREPNDPANWGFIRNEDDEIEMVSIEKALEKF